jgi:hypothetical protein
MRNFPVKGKGLYLTFAVMLLTCSLSSTVFSQASTTTIKDFVPVVDTVLVPCANGGAGELVQVSGTLRRQTHFTINENRVNTKFHVQLLEARGVGLLTGDVYQAVRVTNIIQNFATDGPFSLFTSAHVFMLIGQGPDNNFRAHQNFHTTVNANGELTSTVEHISIDCN